MDEIVRLVRPDIYAMKPYSSARTEGKQGDFIYLDANENPYPPYPGTEDLVGLNRYPEPQPKKLLERFSEFYGFPQEQLFLSRGVDESIDLLVRAFCEPRQDAILITPPTFVMYETAAEIQGASVARVSLTSEFQLDVEAMLDACEQNPNIKLVFVCSPGNPSSSLLNRDDVLRLADGLLGKALIFVDHLYVDYSNQRPLSDEIANHPNIVVGRSLSKEYSLAGERMGITIAHPEVIQVLTRIMAPYSLTRSAIRIIENAMSDEGIAYAKANLQKVLTERDRVIDAFNSSDAITHVFPCDANFVLAQTPDPKLLSSMMEDNGIKIRDRSGVVENAVRISIGTPEENNAMLRVLELYAQKIASA